MSTTTVQISVTADDIEAGICEDCKSCPIALAIIRVLPNSEPRVSPSCVSLGPYGTKNGRAFAWLPDTARWFIKDFDAGLRVAPFTFSLDIPSHLIATGQEVAS